ncbi:hypothetical protein [Candidatus Thioglobus sp.]|uniref:hypothetical protein n=1 Tax=Candidatus Thioglobus sp. TaxID=2026721 RepID=UPI003D101AB3
MQKIIYSILAVAFISGCTTTQTADEKINHHAQNIQNIERGVTTEKQIYETFGEPQSSRMAGGIKTMNYSFGADGASADGAGVSFGLGLGLGGLGNSLGLNLSKSIGAETKLPDLKVRVDTQSKRVIDYESSLNE